MVARDVIAYGGLGPRPAKHMDETTDQAEPPRVDEIELLHRQVRQLILMRETGPKRAGWHAARARLIWRLQAEIARLEAAAGHADRR